MKKICLVTLAFFILTAHFAQAEDVLTWKECVRQAKKHHPDLISAAEEVKQAKADLDIDISAMAPDITSTASAKRARAAAGNTQNTYAHSVTGEQLIFDGFKTASEVSNAFKLLKAQEYNYNVTSSNIRLNLRSAFTDLLKAQELVSLTEQIAGRRKQNLELVKLRYEAGREHKGSLLTAEADLAQAEFEVAQARRNIILAQRQLSKELGIDKMNSWMAKGEFLLEEDYISKPQLEDLALATPFLNELIEQKEAARYNLQSQQSDFFPTVYLNSSVGRTGTTVLPRGKQWSAGASLSFPLFEGGSRIIEADKARSQLEEAKADERSGRNSVLVTLETTCKNLQDAIETVRVKEKFLKAAEERAKITSAQYEAGLTSFDDWVIIEDNLVDAKKAYLTAQANMLSTEAYWIQAIGGTLDYE